MALNDFEGLVKSLSPALARCLLTGDVRCIDSYNRATTITGGTAGIGLTWRRSGKGFYLGQQKGLTAGGGQVSVADAAELRATSGTIFWTAKDLRITAASTQGRILCKRNVGGAVYDLRLITPNQINFYDGVNDRSMVSTALQGSHTGAVRYASGAVPRLFVDGISRVDASGVVAPVDNGASLFLGSYYLNYGGPGLIDYGCFIIFNDAILGRAITDQEIAQLHDAWESIVSVHQPKRTISLPRKATEIVATAPLLHWAGERNPAGLLLDLSGNGRNGTISGRVTQTKDQTGVVQRGYGAGLPLIRTVADAALAPNQWTIHVVCSRAGQGAISLGAIVAMDDDAPLQLMSLHSATGTTMTYQDTYADGIASWSFPVPALSTRPISILLRHDRTNGLVAPYVLVDGEAVVVTTVVAKAGALVAAPNPRFRVLNRYDTALAWDGFVKDVKVYGSLLSDAQCRALYVDYALSDERRLANRTDYPVSVANVTAAGTAGPWRWLRGSLNWFDDGTRRRIVSAVVNSGGTAPSAQAFGAWYWRQRPTVGPDSIYMPIASSPVAYNVAGQNGYAIDLGYIAPNLSFYLFRMTNGAAVALVMSSAVGALAVGVEYEFFLTRRARDGLFSVWVRGGAYATWTVLAVSAADATYTTSVCNNISICNTEYIADVTMIPGGSGLTPQEVPWLM